MLFENESPIILESLAPIRDYSLLSDAYNNEINDAIEAFEIFDLLRNIKDPEHPLTLEQLNIISPTDIHIKDEGYYKLITVSVTPTIPHCSMATLIGLCIRVKLCKSVSPFHKIQVVIKKGTHQSEDTINKQLNDKERVLAAMENEHLLKLVLQCIIIPPKKALNKSCCS